MLGRRGGSRAHCLVGAEVQFGAVEGFGDRMCCGHTQYVDSLRMWCPHLLSQHLGGKSRTITRSGRFQLHSECEPPWATGDPVSKRVPGFKLWHQKNKNKRLKAKMVTFC